MAVSNRKEMAVFKSKKVGHSNPRVLIRLVGIRQRLACLSGKGKLGDTVGVHLLRVCRVE